MTAWLIFAISGTVVVLAGIRLTRSGDTIADVTGLGGAWVGAVFVALATSLPELATDIFAVRIGERNLALGDLFGSSMANMLILAVADLVLWRRSVLARLAVNQALIGLLAISLSVIALAGIVSETDFTVFGVGWAPLIIAMTYLGGMRLLHVYRSEPPFEGMSGAARHAEKSRGVGLSAPVIEFLVATMVIVAAAPFLARSSGDLADQLGVSSGVIGVALLAVTTSLPEVTVTVESFRRGSIDLAVGNLLGSNCVNMVILLPLDVADGRPSLLFGAGNAAMMAGLFAVLLIAQTVFEVLAPIERKVRWLEPDAAFRILTYVVGLYLVFQAGH